MKVHSNKAIKMITSQCEQFWSLLCNELIILAEKSSRSDWTCDLRQHRLALNTITDALALLAKSLLKMVLRQWHLTCKHARHMVNWEELLYKHASVQALHNFRSSIA
jgi:hypothetical protein